MHVSGVEWTVFPEKRASSWHPWLPASEQIEGISAFGRQRAAPQVPGASHCTQNRSAGHGPLYGSSRIWWRARADRR